MTREIEVTEITKLMREEVKEVFPQTEFSVRKTGYDSITVSWTDGPTEKEIQYLLQQFIGYKADHSDPGSDYGDWKRTTTYRVYAGKSEEVQFLLKYLQCRREHSDLFLATVAAQISGQYGLEPLTIKPSTSTDKFHVSASIEHSGQRIGGDWAENFIYRVMRQTSTIEYKLKSSPAEKFHKAADALQKSIDDKRRPRPTHTHRMKNMAESALADARKLELLQDKLRALAEAWDQDKVPEPLRMISTKAQVEYLADDCARERIVGLSDPRGWGRDTYLTFAKIGLGTPELYASAVGALRELGNPDVGKKSLEDKIRELEQDLLLQKIPGFFPTPNPVIDRMFSELPRTTPGMRILEPSAGNGRLAERLHNRFPEAVLDVCEWNYSLGSLLKLKGFNLIASDCFEITEPVYDLVCANPPFEQLADIDHVRHYFTLLKPGGTLISVMSESPFIRKDKKAEEFRDWLAEYGTDYDLPADAFKDGERPTGVKTRYVVIEKPGTSAAPAAVPVAVEPIAEPVEVSPELYQYTSFSRPVLEAAPAGWVKILHKSGADLQTDYDFGVICYSHKLTQEELDKYEFYPVSDNAYTYVIGDKVTYAGFEECEVTALQERGRYQLTFLKNRTLTHERVHPNEIALTPPYQCDLCGTTEKMVMIGSPVGERRCWKCLQQEIEDLKRQGEELNQKNMFTLSKMGYGTPEQLGVKLCDQCRNSTDLILPDAPEGKRLCWGCLGIEPQVEAVLEKDADAEALKAKIERCRAIMEQTRPVWDKPFEAPGAFVTGRSNRPKSLDRMVDRENNRRTEALTRYHAAQRELALLEEKLRLYEAGERHANGQPRADSPSRRKHADAVEEYGALLRTLVNRGDEMAIADNPANRVTVKRINPKSITADSGTSWQFNELLPMVDGQPMTPAQFKEVLKAYREKQNATDVTPAPVCDRCGEAKPLALPDAPEGHRLCRECLELGTCKACGKSLTRAEVDLGTCWNCERINEHYRKIQQAAQVEVERSGIQQHDRVQINWATTAPGYGTVLQFHTDNAGWVLIEDDEQKRRYWIALTGLSKLSSSRAIVPVGERITRIEAIGKKSLTVQPPLRILPKPLPQYIEPPKQSPLPAIGLPPALTLFDLKETVTDPEYAINAADLEWHGDKPELKEALNGLLLDETVQAEQKPDGRARLLNVDREKAQSLIDTIRRNYSQSQVRLYRNKYGSWRQV